MLMELKAKLIKMLMGKGFCIFGKSTKDEKVIIHGVLQDRDFAHKALVASMVESPQIAEFIIGVMQEYIRVTEETEKGKEDDRE